MLISIMLNGKKVVDDISPDMTLFKFLRAHGCYSVKCGCETTNCGLCTVFLDEKPTDEEIKQYLAGNLCRCSGYEGQLRGIHAFMEYRKNGGATCGK